MTTQEELNYVNCMLSTHEGKSNLLIDDGVTSIPIAAVYCCIDNKPHICDIASEFDKILTLSEPALFIVPSQFYDYNTAKRICNLSHPRVFDTCDSGLCSFNSRSALSCCHCGGNNNCCSCNTEMMVPKRYACDHEGCNYSTIRKSDLKIHIRSHTGEKPYKCPYSDCVYAAATRSILVIHIRTHTGEKPLKCPQPGCNYSCSNHSNLKVHIRTHTGEKPFKCTIVGCAYASITSSDLKKHLKVHQHRKSQKLTYQQSKMNLENAAGDVLIEAAYAKCGFTPVMPDLMQSSLRDHECGSS